MRRLGPAGDAPGTQGARDGFLDIVRGIATVRVVLWHAFGFAAITYLVAAMPAMFFVSGSLFAGSFDRHGGRATLFDRLRRIAPSLWVFAAVAWLVMWIGAWRSGSVLDWRHLGLWLLPVGDPAGSAWEAGWLATPLWYLRTLLWIFLLAPIAIRAVRRWPMAGLGVGAAAVFVLDLADRAGLLRPDFADRLVWQLGDVALYGTFFLFGVRTHDGAFRALRPRHWLVVAASAAGAAGLWLTTQPIPEGVVNNSHPMHLFVGLAWLALALSAAPGLRAAAAHHLVRPVVHFLGQRSLTVYLWHTSAVVIALWWLERRGPLPSAVWTASYLAIIAVGVAFASVTFGWIEDLAARRRPRVWAVPLESRRWLALPVGLAVVLCLLVATALVHTTSDDELAAVNRFRPGVPSQAPPAPHFDDLVADGLDAPATVDLVDRGVVTLDEASFDRQALDELIRQWAWEHQIPGAAVGVALPDGPSWVGTVGADDGGRTRDVSDRLDVMSVTKVFTANLVFRAVDAGLLALDEPIPAVHAYPDFPYRVTVRQLLSHRSGLLNYWDSPQYIDDPTSVASPLDALTVAASAPLVFEPGTRSEYSSTNYILLGFLLEQVTGLSLDELFEQMTFAPLGLGSTTHLSSAPGQPRAGTAGILTDLHDLGRAALGLLRDHIGLDDRSAREMMLVDRQSAMGPGVNGFCPCRTGPDGEPRWFALGYAGGHTLMVYLPEIDVAVTVDVNGSFWEDDRFAQVLELVQQIDDLLWQRSQPHDDDVEVVAA